MNILQILDIDKKCRNIPLKGKEDLFTLSSLNLNDSWDYSFPTLVQNENVFLKGKLSRFGSSFNKIFLEKFGYLNPLYLDFSNMLIAGGCIGSFLIDEKINDIDIFIYGLDRESADKKVLYILQKIIECVNYVEHLKNKNKNNELPYTIKRNQNCVTITINNQVIQIIFRLYKSVSEILHGFDIGSSAVGYDGNDVYFTSLSKFSYEKRCNVIDTTRRSTTYENRLIKYFQRGFEIILIGLDLSKVPMHNINYYDDYHEFLDLPYFAFTFRNIVGNKLLLSRFYKKKGCDFVSDYDSDIDGKYQLFYSNLSKLLKKDSNLTFETDSINDIFNITKNVFSIDKIRYHYSGVLNKIVGKNFSVSMVETYLPMFTVDEIFASRKDVDKCENMVSLQIGAIVKQLNDLDFNSIKWRTDNPGSQLTSSFNPIFEDQSTWYGKYYNPNPVETVQIIVSEDINKGSGSG